MDSSKKILSNENLKNGFSFNDTNNELSLKVNNTEKVVSVDENGIKTDLSLGFDVDSGVLSIKGKNNTVINTVTLTNLHNYTGEGGIVVNNNDNKIGIDDTIIVTHNDLTNTLSGLSLAQTEFTGTKVLGKIKQENGIVTVDSRDLSKSDVGLANVDNTSDNNKPVSTLQAAAIKAVDDKVTINTNAITKLNGNDSTEGSVAYAVKQLANGQVKANKEAIAIINGNDETEGSISKSAKDTLVAAKNYTNAEIKKLDKNDTEVDHEFVSAVSETDGIITVSRKALSASDIPDLTLSKISDAGNLASKDSITTNEFSSDLKTDYSKKISGPDSVTTNTVAIFDGTTGKTIKSSEFTIGVSVPSDAKFTDTTYSEATISTSGLMSVADKSKLDGIESGAKVNIIEGVQVNGTDLTVTDKKVNILVPTGALASKDKVSKNDLDITLANELGGKEDKSKLGSLAYLSSLSASNIPVLDAEKITSGTFNAARIPSLEISKITNLQSTLNGKVDEFTSTKRFDLTTDDGIISAIKSILMQMGVAESSITVP